MDKCFICDIDIDRNEDSFYQQRLVEYKKVILFVFCEDCMANLYKCGRCGKVVPYCDDCV